MANDKPKLQLTGQDGNAFSILAQAKKAARKAHWSKEEIDRFLKEATSDNYDYLLQTCFKYFNVS
jgi:hypothetical protein